jgi:hypothetical protein
MRKKGLLVVSILALAVVSITEAFAEENIDEFSSRWDYPSNSAGGVGESKGIVSFSRSSRRTTDSIEKVVLWYADRLGLAKDHSLVENAKAGFSKLESRLEIRSGIGHDTESRQDHLSILGTITREHAHVTMIYQPNPAEKTDVIISITQTPNGTNIHVFRQNPPERKLMRI